jgi:hypothetical protein
MSETAGQFIKRRDRAFRDNLNKYKRSNSNSCLKWLPDINRKGKYGFIREAWTFMRQFNSKEKIYIIERLKRIIIIKPVTHKNLKVGDIEYRFGYYMLGKNGNKVNKWTWGESCTIIPQEDLNKLFTKAKKEKTII